MTARMQEAIDHINSLLQRADAEIISFRKHSEGRLAYPIKGSKRGVYFLVYFKIDHARLVGLERDCNLSELLLRSMVIRTDHLSQEKIESADARQELADEIKLKAEKGDEDDTIHTARIGSKSAPTEETTDAAPESAPDSSDSSDSSPAEDAPPPPVAEPEAAIDS